MTLIYPANFEKINNLGSFQITALGRLLKKEYIRKENRSISFCEIQIWTIISFVGEKLDQNNAKRI